MIVIINKFLLIGESSCLKFIRLAYGASILFIKNKERTQKIKQKEDSRYIYQNRLLKAQFPHDLI